MVDALLFVVSLVGLLFSAEKFVEAAVALAHRLKVSTMVIGLTVVAVGTSLPEAAAGVVASLKGHPEIVFGNVIGSNICNVALILSVPAFFSPIVCRRSVLEREGWVMLGASLSLWVIAFTSGEIARATGVVLFLSFGVFIWWVFHVGEGGAEKIREVGAVDVDENAGRPFLSLIWTLAVMLVSSEFLVRSTVSLATAIGVSENVIALTLIAIGTSLPELSVSIVAVRRNESDILVGNILGSNISNILMVLGVASIVRVTPVSPIGVAFDLPVMIVFALLMLTLLHGKSGVTAKRAVMMLGLYGVVLWRCVVLTP